MQQDANVVPSGILDGPATWVFWPQETATTLRTLATATEPASNLAKYEILPRSALSPIALILLTLNRTAVGARRNSTFPPTHLAEDSFC